MIRTVAVVAMLFGFAGCKQKVPDKPKSIGEVLDRHEASLGSWARSDFIWSANVEGVEPNGVKQLRIWVRRKPFAYREERIGTRGRRIYLSDGQRAWGAQIPARPGPSLGANLGANPGSNPGAQMGVVPGVQFARFVLLPWPASRALLERAFLWGQQYLDRKLWKGRSGVDKGMLMERFPHQPEGFSSGQPVHRLVVLATGEARIHMWFGAEDGRLWGVSEPEVDMRWQRWDRFETVDGSSYPSKRAWGLFDKEGGQTWNFEPPVLVKQHLPRTFPFPRERKPSLVLARPSDADGLGRRGLVW